jgi:A/G-specific adenine glycosylase
MKAIIGPRFYGKCLQSGCVQAFARRLIAWQRRHGRRGLPWQGTRDPYRVWLAEVMLQQTRVETVVPYYRRFVARFPDFAALARAPLDEVLALWSGLGYYARARHLHAAARLVANSPSGRFPQSAAALERLPGVGRSTAAAIAVFAFGERAAILDGNVRRVLARHFGVQDGRAQWRLAQTLLPVRGIETYTQALMDLGATVCRRADPACVRCPVARSCRARREGRVAELPAPRARPKVSRQQASWLVLLEGRRVLLEKRPPAGLWGGLWCFPDLGRNARTRPASGVPTGPALEKRIAQHLCRTLGCELLRIERMPSFVHAFTHLRLEVQPWLCRVRVSRAMPVGGGRRWFGLRRALAAALPAPVRRVLLALRSQKAPQGTSAASARWRTSTRQSRPNASARRSARYTERCRPPVQPIATVT